MFYFNFYNNKILFCIGVEFVEKKRSIFLLCVLDFLYHFFYFCLFLIILVCITYIVWVYSKNLLIELIKNVIIYIVFD